jgi:hypothetical protein
MCIDGTWSIDWRELTWGIDSDSFGIFRFAEIVAFCYSSHGLCAVIPFVAALLEPTSNLFRLPNPWIASMLSILFADCHICAVQLIQRSSQFLPTFIHRQTNLTPGRGSDSLPVVQCTTGVSFIH